MEFDGLKINTPVNTPAPANPPVKPVEMKHEAVNHEMASDQSDVVSGLEAGDEILDKIKHFNSDPTAKVIYGVYNNSDKGIFVQFDDFLIDHSKITLKDKSYFFHMLAVMVDAGIPVVQAVKSLADRAENKHFKRVLDTIGYSCDSGANLSDAMTRFEDIFDELEIGIIKSGEATGNLNTMLFKLADQLDKKHDLSMKLWGAAVYPIAVLVVLVLVATGMLVWIFPSLLSLLKDGGIAGDKLPLATRVLMGLQTAITGYWWVIGLVVFGIYGLFNMYVHSADGAVSWDYTKLRFPIVGQMIKRVQVFNFISMLGILIDSGLPIITSLKITGNSLSNRIYKLKVQEVLNQVKKGSKISESLKDSSYLFPGEIVEMFAVGEASASVAKVCEKISEQYQREIDNSLKKLTSIFEPVMILVVGLFVALLALAIMAPIFNLGSTVGN
ncbi:MAG: type II secretion system F family protein [Candidatus Peregrinibacteria bacterium]|nr:type II secretion system F family protein [Candidatus Peregrinibacteria bacterium]